MRVLGFKPAHDGVISYIDSDRLVFSFEAEKDSNPRYSDITVETVLAAFEAVPCLPDVVALGGWGKPLPGVHWDTSRIGAGYRGLEPVTESKINFFGHPVTFISSTHERSHLFMAAGMSPLAPIEECVILVWEGIIGALYHWEDFGRKITRRHVMRSPGDRYSSLFALADPSCPDVQYAPSPEHAGKLMALASFANPETALPESDAKVVESFLQPGPLNYPFNKSQYRGTTLYNCGIPHDRLYGAAKYLSDRIFDSFYRAAVRHMPKGLPLLISGGCGLNCEWNRRWHDSGLFTSVFVPPCTNDSGTAIGSCLDAIYHLSGPMKLSWDVYSGSEFVVDTEPDASRWARSRADALEIARVLAQNSVVAWVQGRAEIGPRSLGHRSLLASPLLASNRDLLNEIKGREGYRPIAASVLLEDLGKWFQEPLISDPYMLFFNKAKGNSLPAVTHVDGTTRIHTVSESEDSAVSRLLKQFRIVTGVGVLCNTSLNFPGRGFLNNMHELVAYCEAHGVNEIVVNDMWYRRRT